MRAKLGSLDPTIYDSFKSKESEPKKAEPFTLKAELLPIEKKGKKITKL